MEFNWMGDRGRSAQSKGAGPSSSSSPPLQGREARYKMTSEAGVAEKSNGFVESLRAWKEKADERRREREASRPAKTLYMVRPGDTLETIASRHGLSGHQVEALNTDLNPDVMWPGQLLCVHDPANPRALPPSMFSPKKSKNPIVNGVRAIEAFAHRIRDAMPGGAAHRARHFAPGDTAWDLNPGGLGGPGMGDRGTGYTGANWIGDLADANGGGTNRWNGPNFGWPYCVTGETDPPPCGKPGRVSSTYGWRWGAFHSGIDIAAGVGTPIAVAESGRVTYCGWNGGYGKMCKVDHGNGLETVYGHAHDLWVNEGQVVKRGQPLGSVGNTGRSTGPHLHFEIRKNGRTVDPYPVLTNKDWAGREFEEKRRERARLAGRSIRGTKRVKHSVSDGDSLETLAGTYGTSPEEISKTNGMGRFPFLYCGQEIEIEAREGGWLEIWDDAIRDMENQDQTAALLNKNGRAGGYRYRLNEQRENRNRHEALKRMQESYTFL